MHLKSLYEECLKETAWHLRNSYWSSDSQAFKKLSSIIIDDLISNVTQISTAEPLESSHLQLLTTSGRVGKFIWKCTQRHNNPSAETIRKILTDLSTACHNLRTVNLTLNLPTETRFDIITPALNGLLCKARKVEFVESDIVFDLRALCNSIELKELVINFELRNHIYDFLEVNGRLRIHNMLTHLFIDTARQPIESIHSEIHIVLKHCTQLLDTNIDIAEALERLHAEELKNGALTQRYKIQCCILGNHSVCASEIAVRIASVTCPDITRLDLTVNDTRAISALCNFQSVQALTLNWSDLQHADYATDVQQILRKEEFGKNISYLTLHHFFNVDFTSIGVCCPYLNFLSLEDSSLSYDPSVILPTSFPKLQSLFLNGPDDTITDKEQLAELLYSAVNLKYLSLNCPLRLNDGLLEDVLRRNSLSNLDTLWMSESDLSLEGIRLIVSTLKSLQSFTLDVCEIDEDLIVEIFDEINPHVDVKLGL